jgi:hypothetical protein
MHNVTSLVTPAQCAGIGINGVDISISASEVNCTARNRGRRKIKVLRALHHLGRGMRAQITGRDKSMLTSSCK